MLIEFRAEDPDIGRSLDSEFHGTLRGVYDSDHNVFANLDHFGPLASEYQHLNQSFPSCCVRESIQVTRPFILQVVCHVEPGDGGRMKAMLVPNSLSRTRNRENEFTTPVFASGSAEGAAQHDISDTFDAETTEEVTTALCNATRFSIFGT